MVAQRNLLASAVMSALASFSSTVIAQEQTLPAVTVKAAPFSGDETAQILAPARVLSGNELRDKINTTLGGTLEREPGVSASSFGAGASRPVIRGLEGPRVKILQNGMAVSDVSSLSSDHAVATESSSARQIEILRGPAALLYGSGAIGGLVNVVNDRIPTELAPQAYGEAEMRFGSVDKAREMSFSADRAVGSIGLHIDGHARNTDNYRIPGFAVLDDPDSASGRLPSSFTRSRGVGIGASHIARWGHVGASVDVRDDRYGIPTEERAFIDLSQTRFDIDALIKQPLSGLESFRFKLGASDYKHTEKLEDGTPATDFNNDAIESRWEATHAPLAGWRGVFGLQTDNNKFSAISAETGRPDTVPTTKSRSLAAFIVEERDFGPVRASAGLRLESVKRRPDAPDLSQRSFDLSSYSLGGLWTFAPGYGFGTTLSIAQRAPTTEELYSNGPHEATLTFDVGDPALRKETSRNIELSLQKTEGLVRWKANVFRNRFRDFIYGRSDGTLLDEEGIADPAGEFRQRFWSQAGATIRGAELEASYNLRGEGWSLRGFADTSRGRLDGAGNLPLQPATRAGLDVGYKQGAWRGGISALHAKRQDRLAAFETVAIPSYTRLDASLSYTQRLNGTEVTWFALFRNLLDEEIRLSTSALREFAPQAGRNLIVGVRGRF
ncbi:MAG TPA: TonB-dependent receptor [Noviherbaspirillum sp.]|jgi:iron complex outermembrane receptor protein|uniref:TonB-dependent receptor n=1 Tax=Noviherbaspirillum sp. TaxID=1926288 RepID=UPI002DDCB69C|nr:TonB-dependent receptor [Noviherbaspirillum sp.]HEV2611167.1 TonB-dependent receptor [Noviherbaspirillum sp.]